MNSLPKGDAIRVLYFDDDASGRDLVRLALSESPQEFQVAEVSTRQDLEAHLLRGAPDLLLTDLNSAGFDGLELIEVALRRYPGMPVVIVTGSGSEEIAVEAMKRGASDYLIKRPAHLRRLPHALRSAAANARIRQEGLRAEEDLRRLVRAIETLEIGVTITDAEGTILYTNPAEARMHGYRVEELLGQSARVFAPDDRWNPISPERLRGLRGWRRESVNRHRDGHSFPVQLLSDAVTSGTGLPVGVVTCCVDISERKRAENALLASEQRYRTLFERNLAGVYRRDLDGRILECNDSFARIFGFASVEEVLGNASWSLEPDPERRQACAERLRRDRALADDEVLLACHDGRRVWVLRNETLIPAGPGEAPVVAGTLVDITARKEAEGRIAFQAFHDALTGLPNRALFLDRLTMAIGQARREGRHLAVLFLDLDHFKLINDTFGHEAGDRLLRAATDRLHLCIRAHDTVARVGGDEFTILLPTLRHKEDSVLIARKVLDAIEKPFYLDGQELFLTVSIGISLCPEDGDSPEALLKSADRALYRAKEEGRNTFRFSLTGRTELAADREAFEASLRAALGQGDLSILYRPIADLRTGGTAGAEAVLHWSHPERGLLPPGEFLPIAEDAGLILRLGEWLLDRACRQGKAWRERGRDPGRVSISISPRQLRQMALASLVERTLEETGLDPNLLEIEISEAAATQNVDVTLPLLRRLADLGVGLCLGSFGTGSASLGYLQRLPLRALKIHSSFIRGIESEIGGRSVVKAIVELAHSFGLRVTAGGVATAGQRATLGELGCDEFQGPLLGEACPAEEFEETLASAG